MSFLLGREALDFLRSSLMRYSSLGVPTRKDHRGLDDETCSNVKVSKNFSFVELE